MRLSARSLLVFFVLLVAAPSDARPSTGVAPTWADEELERLAQALDRELGEPGALIHLAELRSLIDEVTDLPRLREVLLRAAWQRRAHGEVRAYARWSLAQVEWRRGRRPRAEKWASTLGLATEGWLVGPFANEGGSGHDEAYPPEVAEAAGQAPDPSIAWPGKEHPVRWRPLPPISPLGIVDLSALVNPSQEVVVYVRVVVESDAVHAAVLRLGSPGATKVWVGGDLVHADGADHPARFDQTAIPVMLGRGRTPILLKLAQREGGLDYLLRITDLEGDRLRGVRVLPAEEGRSTVATRPVPKELRRRPVAADTILGRAAQRAKAQPASLEARLLHAQLLAMRHPFDRTTRAALDEARAAAAIRPEDPKAAAAFHLVARLEDDDNRRREALERALQARPDHLEARLALAQHHLAHGQPRRAVPLLSAVVAEHDNHVRAQIALADAESRAGFPEDRRRRIDRLLAAYPVAPEVLHEAASVARDRGRPDEAANHLRVGAGLYADDASLRSILVSVLLELGDLEGAVAQLRHETVFAPAGIYPRLRLAELLSTNGRPEEADAVLAEAAALAPEDPRVVIRLARHHLRHDRLEEAREAVARAQVLAPQDSEVSELARFLSEDGDDFAAPWRGELREVAAAAEARTPEGEDAWTLLDLKVVRVHRNGLQSRVQQEIHQALTPRGAEKLRGFSISYTPGEQTVRLLQARVLKPDGTVVHSRSESERSLSEPWYRLYYDRRARVVSFPSVEPGDVVEVTWRLDDVASENMFGDYFGDMEYLQGTRPIARSEYVLIGPAGRKFHFNEPALPGIAHTRTDAPDGTQILHWVAEDVPRIVPEPGMPGWSEVAAYLHVSTFESWSDVATWWWRLIEDQLVPGPELSRLAQELVARIPASDERGRVAAIHNYVVKRTRYVGLEFGIHGFKPYRVDQIHERRFGDCKDKASLMYAMLQAVGIDSRMVILRMRKLGRLPEYPASLAVFNHAILYVPQLDLWLDGTAEYAGTGELPSQDRGAAVIVVEPSAPRTSRFLHTPHPDAGVNTSDTEVTFVLDAEGGAEASGRFEVGGTAAPGYRQGYQAEESRRQKFEESWAASFPGVSVRALEMTGLGELEQRVEARFQLEIPRLAHPEGNGLSVSPFGTGKSYTERYAALSRRGQDLVLGYPFVSRFRYELVIPAGWRVADLPESAVLEGPHGRFRLDWTREGDRLVAEGELELSRARIPADGYPGFRTFLGDVDRALDRKVRLAPATEAASAGP